MEREDCPVVGTELKMNISIAPMGDVHMADYDFSAEFYTRSSSVLHVPKESMIMQDADNYVAVVDTEKLGAGTLKCKLTAFIPDFDCDDGFRTEIVRMNTDVEIIR